MRIATRLCGPGRLAVTEQTYEVDFGLAMRKWVQLRTFTLRKMSIVVRPFDHADGRPPSGERVGSTSSECLILRKP